MAPADHTWSATSLEDAPTTPGVPYRRTFAKTFDVLVGQDNNQQLFPVHHKVLVKRSGFFRKARNSRWNTDKSLPVDLHDVDLDLFDMYLHCVYLKKVPELPAIENVDEDDGDTELRLNTLVNLYIVADRFLDEATKTLVIEEIAFISWTENHPQAGTINYVYRNTVEGSSLRDALVKHFVNEATALPDGALPNAFLRSVAGMQMSARCND